MFNLNAESVSGLLSSDFVSGDLGSFSLRLDFSSFLATVFFMGLVSFLQAILDSSSSSEVSESHLLLVSDSVSESSLLFLTSSSDSSSYRSCFIRALVVWTTYSIEGGLVKSVHRFWAF